MDNKKLMHILLRDVQELEELVVEMHQTGTCDRLDMELLRTRISGVRHLLEAAAGMKEADGGTSARPLPPAEYLPPPSPPTSEPAAPAARELRFEEPKPATEIKPLVEDLFFQTTVPEEVKEVQPEKHTLGEKFTAGKSVHDLLMTEKAKSDLKFSNIPIPSLASAIGTNDRFLFTRELFEGNMEQFTETIRRLDAMTNIRKAVDFLQENFNWKKSETSNKFLELVKRRFL